MQVHVDEIESALGDLKAGKLIVVVDDEHRENEGDLVCAAEHATPANINFMATHGRGLICVAMEHEQLLRLGLAGQRVFGRVGKHFTAFAESVDAAQGITTGISAFDRAETIRVLIDENAQPEDLIRPGHMFPLKAAKGGVFQRRGHTEAAVDLARLAGLKPAGVICEILREDGHMARMPELEAFCHKHHLKMVRIRDLVAYRLRNEKIVEREQTVQLPTRFGLFRLHMYKTIFDESRHLALVCGHPSNDPAPLLRIHSECLTGDVFGSLRCDCGPQLEEAMRMIAERGEGIILYMRQEGRGIGLAPKIHAYALQESGMDTVQANEHLGYPADMREYDACAAILKHMLITRVRLLTNNPQKIRDMESNGIEVVERVPLIVPKTPHNETYLETKRKKLGHMLDSAG